MLAPAQSAIDLGHGDDYFSAIDDDLDLDEKTAGPSDSHYELPRGLNDDEDDTDLADWSSDAIPTRSSPHEIAPATTGQGRPPDTEPWYYRAALQWGRIYFIIVIGFTAVSITVIGGLVIAELTGNLSVDHPALAIVAGTIVTIALSSISLSTSALQLLLFEIARHLHTLAAHSDPSANPTPRS